ncbi:MAG: hypothetical protein WCI92_19765, partial [Bacteroidota bacterium]
RDEKTCGYAIFDASKALKDKWIQQVNIPSIVMLKELSHSKVLLTLTDPDMHRPFVSTYNSLTRKVEEASSQPFDYEIVLNGQFTLDGIMPHVRLITTDKTTKIALQVVDGKSYMISLKKQ